MVAVMTLHLGALTGNLIDAVVIGAVKLCELVVEIVSLSGQFVIDVLNVVDLRIVLKGGTVQI